MRRRDKILIMTEANKRLESSWLKERHFITENTLSLDSLSKNDTIKDLAQSLASDPEKLKKAVGELISLGISKDVIVNTAKKLEGESQLTEVEDDDIFSTKPEEKDWVDRNFEMTGQGGLKDAVAGAKLGGILGTIGGIIVDDIALHAGAADPQNLMKTLLVVVAMAVGTAGFTAYLGGKGIK